jgi:hypothetical protein
MKLVCDGKVIEARPSQDGKGIEILVEYPRHGQDDVMYLTNEEADLFAQLIKQVLGKEQPLTPKEKIKL